MASPIGTIVIDGGTCLKIAIQSDNIIDTVDGLVTGITFFVGLVIGGIIAICYAKFKFHEISDSKIFNPQKAWGNVKKKPKEQDVEKLIQRDVESPVEPKPKKVLKGRRGKSQKMKDEPLVPIRIITLNQGNSSNGDEQSHGSKTLADILMSEKMGVDLATYDLEAIEEVDKELNEENINVMIQMLRVLLRQQIMEGRLSDMEYKNILKRMQDAVENIVSTCQKEKEKEELDLKEKLKNDPDNLEMNIDMLHTKYIIKMRNQLNAQREKLYKDMSKDSKLSEEEIETIMTQYSNCMLESEKRLETERKRQEKILSKRLDERKGQSETIAIGDVMIKSDMKSRTEAWASTMDALVDDNKLLDRQKQTILDEYEISVQNLEEIRSNEAKKQQEQLTERLKIMRNKKMKEVVKNQEEEREVFLQRAETSTSTEKVMDAYHELLQDQRNERDKVTYEMDTKDFKEFEHFKKGEKDECDKMFTNLDNKIHDRLQQQASLTESEANKLIRSHQSRMKELEIYKKEEKRRLEEKMHEELRDRKAKREESKAMRMVESNNLKTQQEKKIKIVLDSQIDLSEEARKRIMSEHEKNQMALSNQIEMSRLRQQKRLEQRLETRKAKVEQLKQKAKEASLLKTKERQKILDHLKEEIEEEERLLEEDKKNKKTEMRNRILNETKLLLEEEEKHLSELIARLQVSAARRQVEIQRQQRQIKELEDNVANYVENPQTKIPSECDAQVNELLRRHEERVEVISQHISQEKERQEEIMREKLNRKMMQRERTMETKLEDTFEAEKEMNDKRNAGIATKIFSKLLMDSRHRSMIKNLEKDMDIEMQKRKDELDREMENKLESQLDDQKKKFLASVAAMTNMSKNDINGIVEDTITETGGDAKDMKRLAKEMKNEIEQAKSEMYEAQQSDDSNDARYRRRNEYDSDDNDYDNKQRRPKKQSRPKSSKRHYDD